MDSNLRFRAHSRQRYGRARDLQYRRGQPVYLRRLHRHPETVRGHDQHGWQGPNATKVSRTASSWRWAAHRFCQKPLEPADALAVAQQFVAVGSNPVGNLFPPTRIPAEASGNLYIISHGTAYENYRTDLASGNSAGTVGPSWGRIAAER